MLVNVKKSFGISGKDAQNLLDDVGITCNKNGIRLGTPAVTTRGMKEPEMAKIASLICDMLTDSEANAATVREGVKELLAGFPLYDNLYV